MDNDYNPDNSTLVRFRLETSSNRLLTTANKTQRDDFSMGVAFEGEMTYTAESFFFKIVNVKIFQAGSYNIYLSINSNITGRSNKFSVLAGAPSHLFFKGASSMYRNAIAGNTELFEINVVDEYGNFVLDLPDVLNAVVTGRLSARAPWLPEPHASSWVSGKKEAKALEGLFVIKLTFPYAGNFTVNIDYKHLNHSVFVVVTAANASQIRISKMPKTFKIDTINLGSLPDMPYTVAVQDSWNNTIYADSINIRMAEKNNSADAYPKECGNQHECRAELIIYKLESELRFQTFDENNDGNWSNLEYTKYFNTVQQNFPNDYFSTSSFGSMDISKDGWISRTEFQQTGITIGEKKPFLEINHLRIKRPNQRYSLILSWRTISSQTSFFDVKVGDPFKVSVKSECPKPPAGYCGKVGQFLYRDFTATLLDPVDNVCTDMTGIDIEVSIHPGFMTLGAYVQGGGGLSEDPLWLALPSFAHLLAPYGSTNCRATPRMAIS